MYLHGRSPLLVHATHGNVGRELLTARLFEKFVKLLNMMSLWGVVCTVEVSGAGGGWWSWLVVSDQSWGGRHGR